MLRNAIIDHRRRSGAAGRKHTAFQLEVETHPEPEPELQQAICHCVGELASTLKDEYADALRAIEIDGLPVKDFAQRANISTSNAGVRIFRPRKRPQAGDPVLRKLRRSRLLELHVRPYARAVWRERGASLRPPG